MNESTNSPPQAERRRERPPVVSGRMTDARTLGRGMPLGWFQIAWSAQLEPGQVIPLHYFGQELALMRAESGVVRLFDAYCPHIGAHLGHGGCAKGENIVCPFHGWEWSPSGENVAIPYSSKTNTSKQLRAWHVEELGNSVILAWYHPNGEPPSQPLPDAPELGAPEYYPAYPHSAKLYGGMAMHPEWVPENSVDMAHFQFVHETPDQPTFISADAEGTNLRVQFSMRMKHFTPGVERGSGATNVVDARTEIICWGMGVMISRFELDDSLIFQSHTPVDEYQTDLFYTVLVPRPAEASHDVPKGPAQARIKMLQRQIENDIPIWTNRRMEPKPALALEEARTFKLFADWKQQFYV